MQRIFKQFSEEVSPEPVSLRIVGKWAMENGLWEPYESDILSKFQKDMAEALREETRTDAAGRRYRAKHAVRVIQDGKQTSIWADIDVIGAPRDHFEKSFAQRRKHIVGECHQLRMDVDHYNASSGEEPVQMILDFTDDVEELLFVEGLAQTA